jgi:dephospho-CoA kinase
MGKSTVSRHFKALGFRVFDADAVVHQLYSQHGSAGTLLAPHFPTAVQPDGSVDRQALAAQVLTQPDALRLLESIVHPLVRSIDLIRFLVFTLLN